MIRHLRVIVTGKSRAALKSLKQLLSRDTRPDFLEDVPSALRWLYDAIEVLNYPETIKRLDTAMYIRWYCTALSVQQYEEILQQAGYKVTAAHYAPDDPYAADVPDYEDGDDEDGYFFVLADGELRRVTSATLPAFFPQAKLPALDFKHVKRTLIALNKLVDAGR